MSMLRFLNVTLCMNASPSTDRTRFWKLSAAPRTGSRGKDSRPLAPIRGLVTEQAKALRTRCRSKAARCVSRSRAEKPAPDRLVLLDDVAQLTSAAGGEGRQIMHPVIA
jgi:hypothetical protein